MLEVENLVVSRGGKRVLKGVSLMAGPGQVLGLLGRNGAGKTTTLKVVAGLLAADSGTVRRGDDAGRRPMGCLLETPGFYPNLTADENLLLFSRDRSKTGRDDIARVLGQLGLTSTGPKPVGMFSLGMRQRLGIARAILGRPGLVLLDEPTNGLDPEGIKDIRDLIRRLADEEGTTIVVSSHLLGEVERVADRVALIEAGRTVAQFDVGSTQDLFEGTIEVEVSDPTRARHLVLARWPQIPIESRGSRGLEVGVVPGGPAALNRLLVEGGLEVSSLAPARASLETEVFRILQEGQGHDPTDR